MEGEYFLYTVTGVREPYYAAVDWNTGRVWTSPTKDAANRQAREAGLQTCREQVISKDELLRSLGIGPDIKPRRSGKTSPPEDSFDRPIRLPTGDPARQSPTPWFVPGAGGEEGDKAPKFSAPRAAGKKKGMKNASPFAANRPIGAAADDTPDDFLIVPSTEHAPTPPATFSDQLPPPPKEPADDSFPL